MTTNTIKHCLYFFSADRLSYTTIRTKAAGRNADGVMTYESPADCFKRAAQFIDFGHYKFDHAEAF